MRILPFWGKNAIKFETVEPHLKYLRLTTVNVWGWTFFFFFDSEDGLIGL
uniref:Uncharacterized protein n=1 Tax=Prolemur simus TaxID=1328070 RepID=A0A8C9AFG2_PROSS